MVERKPKRAMKYHRLSIKIPMGIYDALVREADESMVSTSVTRLINEACAEKYVKRAN